MHLHKTPSLFVLFCIQTLLKYIAMSEVSHIEWNLNEILIHMDLMKSDIADRIKVNNKKKLKGIY